MLQIIFIGIVIIISIFIGYIIGLYSMSAVVEDLIEELKDPLIDKIKAEDDKVKIDCLYQQLKLLDILIRKVRIGE